MRGSNVLLGEANAMTAAVHLHSVPPVSYTHLIRRETEFLIHRSIRAHPEPDNSVNPGQFGLPERA